MKRLLAIALGTIFLMSCNNKGQQSAASSAPADTPESLAEWYDNVFTFAEADTTSSIPDYVYSTDWMRRYAQYIESHFEERGDMWFEKTEDNPFDCRYWTMAYVDNDTIPELLLYGGCWASGAIILTQFGGEVYVSPRGRFSYIKGAGGLLHSRWKHDDVVWGEIYEMKNGKFTEIANYSLNTDFVDTSKVGSYGLVLDSLKCNYAGGEIGDSVVSISEIELNGKRLGACFGYNQYVNCTDFAKLKQALESLYYTKGTSTFFSFPPENLSINELIDKCSTRNNPQ